MNQVATISPRQKSVTVDMADRFGMEPQAFEQTLRATVFPGNGTREQFAAFLLVAKQYDLNPITKELYAFPAKGGGIVPIVSIDGWLKLINSHPQFDGMDFEDVHDDKGELVATKCTLWRKDRTRPIVVTEYLSECHRATDPWKMKHRMLRHKALIQTARYAFGFAGIYDPDEGERIVEATARPAPSAPPAPIDYAAAPSLHRTHGAPSKKLPPAPPPLPALSPPKPEPAVPAAFDFVAYRAALDAAETLDAANAIYADQVERRALPLTGDEQDEADNILREIGAKFWNEGE